MPAISPRFVRGSNLRTLQKQQDAGLAIRWCFHLGQQTYEPGYDYAWNTYGYNGQLRGTGTSADVANSTYPIDLNAALSQFGGAWERWSSLAQAIVAGLVLPRRQRPAVPGQSSRSRNTVGPRGQLRTNR